MNKTAVDHKNGWLRSFATSNQKLIIALGLLFFSAFNWYWIFTIDIAKLSQSRQTSFVIAVMAYLLIVAITTAVLFAGYIYIKSHHAKFTHSKWLLFLFIFSAWALFELFASWLVSIIWYGQDGSLDTFLPFSSLSPYIMYTPLGYLSRLVGFHGLSAALVALVSIFAIKETRKYTPSLVFTVIVLTGISYVAFNEASHKPVNTAIVADTKESELPINESVRLIILPEYGFNYRDKNSLINPEEKETIYVGSKYDFIDENKFNTGVVLSSHEGIVFKQAKNRLIPGGEYLPFLAEKTLSIFGSKADQENFMVYVDTSKSNKQLEVYAADENLILGASICSSIISTNDYRRFAKEGATVFTNSASMEIFEGSNLFYAQYYGMSKFMAVANARPFAQSTYTGPAFAYDQNGQLISRIEPSNIDTVQLSPNSKLTPYTILGEWPAYIGAIIAAYLLFARFASASKKDHKQNSN